MCIASFYPGLPDVTYDVPGPVIDLTTEEVSIVFTLPVGLDPVTPGVRSIVFLNRPGGPSGPVGTPSDFLTLTASAPFLDLGQLVQLFELFFQSEGATGFDVNVIAVQATGAPELTATGEFQDISGLLDTAGVINLWVGSEADLAPIPEPSSWLLLGCGLASVAARRFIKRT